jgi:hypothetical protein
VRRTGVQLRTSRGLATRAAVDRADRVLVRVVGRSSERRSSHVGTSLATACIVLIHQTSIAAGQEPYERPLCTDTSHSPLVLHEQSALAFPDGFRPEGLIFAEQDSTWLAWSSVENRLVLARGDGVHVVGVPSQIRMVAAVVRGGRYIEIVDSASSSVVQLSPDGTVISALHSSAPGPLISADPAEDGWYLATRSADAVHIYFLSSISGVAVERARLTLIAPPVHLRSVAGGVWVGELMSPFRSVLVDSEGGVVRQSVAPDVETIMEVAGGPPSYVRALPLVNVGAALLQSFANLRTDARVIVRYDPLGCIVQTVPIGMPLGLARSLSDSVVVAIRGNVRSEVVVYVVRRRLTERRRSR